MDASPEENYARSFEKGREKKFGCLIMSKRIWINESKAKRVQVIKTSDPFSLKRVARKENAGLTDAPVKAYDFFSLS